MNISVFIGRRLSFSNSADSGKGAGASPGVPIAVGGIALAVLIMMLSLSVVMGFKEEIRRKVTGFSSEITVYPLSRTLASAPAIDLSPALMAAIAEALPDAVADPVVELPGILKTDDNFQGVMVKAYSPEAEGYRFIEEHIAQGSMPAVAAEIDSLGVPSRPGVMLSATTAAKLGLAVGSKVDMHFVSDGSLRSRRAIVSGIYDTHLGEYDSRFVYVAPYMARSVAKLADNEATAIEINGIGEQQIAGASSALSAAMLSFSSQSGGSHTLGVDNVLRTGQAYFSWLDLLDTNVVVIIVLMALVSGFTLISSLFILILERVRTIGILKSLGATNRQIRGIFIYMAERLVARGLIVGNAAALIIILAQYFFHLIPLDAESYFLSSVPVALCWEQFLILNLAVILLSALILILPSHLIATLAPSESMRYE